MCIEHFRYLMSRHKTIQCPSESIEDSCFLCFFLVDLSHRKAVLLRGVRFEKVRVESTRTHLFLCTTFLSLLWSTGCFPCRYEDEGYQELLFCGVR